MPLFILFLGKFLSFISRKLNIGAGATWPGEVALRLDPNILSKIAPKNIILVAGTNGKTTTTLMIKTILEKAGRTVIHNASGANLLNGIVSAIITNPLGEWGVFEVDENALPGVISNIKYQISNRKRKLIVVLLNLFRDQLDRYGEVDVIAEKWMKSIPKDCQIIANADDPLIVEIAGFMSLRDRSDRVPPKALAVAHGDAISSQNRDRHASLAMTKRVTFFGLDDPNQYAKKMEHATDSAFCPRCGTRLIYKGVYYSHIGDWRCPKCQNKRPPLDVFKWDYPLPGLYNRYNTLAAVSTAKTLGIADEQIKRALRNFSPAFGRQEEFIIGGKKVRILLSKNPAGFNESLRTVIQLGAKQILFILNDRIPDGRDVSWIWDVDFEMLPAYITPVVSGDRAHDLGLRLKYAKPYHKLPPGAVSEPSTPVIVYEELDTALRFCLSSPSKKDPLYILPTYSAMLEIRKILSGKKYCSNGPNANNSPTKCGRI